MNPSADSQISQSQAFSQFQQLANHLNQRIIGQPKLVERLLIALLCDGHLLVEGAPGLAKTKAIKALSECIEGDFHRLQFTPDLLPADLTGTDVYHAEDGSFRFQQGPLFHNLVLADEINRAPAKVQSALLEAMAERQITIGRHTYPLPKLFLVMATQNPIEQEGTYPLPEAQLDRFLMHVQVGYPEAQAEASILKLARQEALAEVNQPTEEQASPPFQAGHACQVSQKTIFDIRNRLLTDIHMSEAVENYIVQLVLATRKPEAYCEKLVPWLRYGASPRATISLDRTARAHAWLKQKDFVSPEDIHSMIHDVFRHRLILSYEAEAEGIRTDDCTTALLEHVAIP